MDQLHVPTAAALLLSTAMVGRPLVQHPTRPSGTHYTQAWTQGLNTRPAGHCWMAAGLPCQHCGRVGRAVGGG